MQSRWVDYQDQGFVALSAYSEDYDQQTPTVDDLAEWAEHFELDYPVLTDPGGAVDELFDPAGATRPTYVLFSPGAVVERIGGAPSDEQIEALLPGG